MALTRQPRWETRPAQGDDTFVGPMISDRTHAAILAVGNGARCDECRHQQASCVWNERALCETCYPIEVGFARVEQIAAQIHGQSKEE